MKVIFLSIDGILNSENWNKKHEADIQYKMCIDENKIRLLSLLINNTKARIVLYSNWKKYFNENRYPVKKEAIYLKGYFDKYNIEISDFTEDNGNIIDEITTFVEDKKIDKWIVIDEVTIDKFSDRQIKVDSVTGLQTKDVLKAQELLA